MEAASNENGVGVAINLFSGSVVAISSSLPQSVARKARSKKYLQSHVRFKSTASRNNERVN